VFTGVPGGQRGRGRVGETHPGAGDLGAVGDPEDRAEPAGDGRALPPVAQRGDLHRVDDLELLAERELPGGDRAGGEVRRGVQVVVRGGGDRRGRHQRAVVRHHLGLGPHDPEQRAVEPVQVQEMRGLECVLEPRDGDLLTQSTGARAAEHGAQQLHEVAGVAQVVEIGIEVPEPVDDVAVRQQRVRDERERAVVLRHVLRGLQRHQVHLGLTRRRVGEERDVVREDIGRSRHPALPKLLIPRCTILVEWKTG
jgi:hypothetical protein